MKARGASVVLFIKQSLAEQLKEDYELVLLPDLEDKFMVFPAAVALQLLAYYVSSDKGFDVDKPRNLAKVVTVEKEKAEKLYVCKTMYDKMSDNLKIIQ